MGINKLQLIEIILSTKINYCSSEGAKIDNLIINSQLILKTIQFPSPVYTI